LLQFNKFNCNSVLLQSPYYNSVGNRPTCCSSSITLNFLPQFWLWRSRVYVGIDAPACVWGHHCTKCQHPCHIQVINRATFSFDRSNVSHIHASSRQSSGFSIGTVKRPVHWLVLQRCQLIRKHIFAFIYTNIIIGYTHIYTYHRAQNACSVYYPCICPLVAHTLN
jgi:hypothetical protein